MDSTRLHIPHTCCGHENTLTSRSDAFPRTHHFTPGQFSMSINFCLSDKRFDKLFSDQTINLTLPCILHRQLTFSCRHSEKLWPEVLPHAVLDGSLGWTIISLCSLNGIKWWRALRGRFSWAAGNLTTSDTGVAKGRVKSALRADVTKSPTNSEVDFAAYGIDFGPDTDVFVCRSDLASVTEVTTCGSDWASDTGVTVRTSDLESNAENVGRCRNLPSSADVNPMQDVNNAAKQFHKSTFWGSILLYNTCMMTLATA